MVATILMIFPQMARSHYQVLERQR